MKKFFIFTVLLIAFMVWFEDWTSSGRMDVFLQEHSDPDVTPKIVFLIGESCFTAKEYKAASFYFQWLVEQYPESDHVPRARFHLAESYEDIGDKRKAMEQYVVLKDSFTGTDYGNMAKKRWEMSL